ncbi:ubiquitin-conjugating enzyme/RWD-like protein [Glomus cerebriforme]|uniref:Ubiquitin-conjugating enzyme/RWD-like protein n=1 Tax=Glomus cerebriforme TaxID=658196 RepID=A0A397SI47_9GLOM|nr:ubiquitin-conjugating enzyme/RWD-like protein [Glomus cerebriforme]
MDCNIDLDINSNINLEKARKRINVELRNINLDQTVNAGPIGNNLFHWMATVNGPSGSPYSGGVFFLEIRIPANYPWKPPKINFTTKIYHPNIDSSGNIGMEDLNYLWSPAITIPQLISLISSLLTTPNSDIILEPEIAHVRRTDRARYEDTAREWTTKYASEYNQSILIKNA